MRIVSVLTAAMLFFLLIGCGNANNSDYRRNAYLIGKKPPERNPYAVAIEKKNAEIEKAKIEAQVQEKIAQIEKEKALGVQQIKSQTDLSRADTDKEITLKELEAQKFALEKEEETKRLALEKEHTYRLILLGIVAAALLLLFVFLFYHNHKKRRHEQEERERERLLKLQMQEQELKMQMAKEMLGALTSDKIPPEQKNRLIETIHHTTAGHLIEHKKP